MEIDDALTSLYEAYNGHSPSQVAARYRTDGRHVEVAQGNERSGRDAIREGLARFFEAFPDAHWAERARIVAADCAAVTYTLTGTLRAQLGPFEPAGQRLELNGVHVVYVAKGEITLIEDYWDAATFARQMGAQGGS